MVQSLSPKPAERRVGRSRLRAAYAPFHDDYTQALQLVASEVGG
jgi:hypothetical protein